MDSFKSPSFIKIIQFCSFHNLLVILRHFREKILRPLKYETWLLLSHGIFAQIKAPKKNDVTIILQERKYCELGWCCHMGFPDCFRIPNQSYLTDNYVTITWQNLVQVSLICGMYYKKIVKISRNQIFFRAFIIPREDRLRLESFNKIFLWGPGQTFLLVLENLKIPKILKNPSGILTTIALEYYITGTI